MIGMDLPAVANHLWQSTLCAGGVWALSFVHEKNRAAVRYRLWLAASLKFLIPFSLIVKIGSVFGWRTVPAASPLQWYSVVGSLGRPLAVPVPAPHGAAQSAADVVPALLLTVWLCGFAISLLAWHRSWRGMMAVRRRATCLHLDLPIPAMSCPAPVEPGVFGIRRPVLLLPQGIEHRLTPDQLDAIVAHEVSHARRHDNLTGAAHLAVEAVFWFYPLVWWIRGHLLEERERACDEAVLRAGAEPQTYAEGILQVCKFYAESRPVCVSGITGGNLRRRIERIVASRVGRNLDWGRKLLLFSAGFLAATVPAAIGLLHAHPVHAQSPSSASLSFEVASVKPNNSGSERSPSLILPGGRFTATNNTVRELILNAYGISTSPYLLEGGPGWIDSARYDIEAKAGADVIPAGTPNRVLWEKTRLMLQSLLADRFKLSIRRETKEMPVYQLVVAKNGTKLQKSDRDCDASLFACHGFSGNPRLLSGFGVDMYDLASWLSRYSDRPIIDRTGVQGLFDIKLQWNVFPGRPPATDDRPPGPAAKEGEGPMPDSASLPILPQALQQQLGLTLESHKSPVEVYVIDRVERPSGN
jgi:bla regulator protein BlaR1